MKEIEKLIESAQDVIATRDMFADSYLVRLAEAKTAAESMLSRAVVIKDSHFVPESLERVVSFCHVKPLNALEGKRVRILVISEADNEK